VLLDHFFGACISPAEAIVETLCGTGCDIAVLPSRLTKDVGDLYCTPDYGANNEMGTVQKLVFIGILGEVSSGSAMTAHGSLDHVNKKS
jgi:hypothetical protein